MQLVQNICSSPTIVDIFYGGNGSGNQELQLIQNTCAPFAVVNIFAGGTAAAPTVPGLALKAPLANPTFTGTVTAPIYDSAPQNLTSGTAIRRSKKLEIGVHAIEQPIDLSIPESKVMLALYLAIP